MSGDSTLDQLEQQIKRVANGELDLSNREGDRYHIGACNHSTKIADIKRVESVTQSTPYMSVTYEKLQRQFIFLPPGQMILADY